jgi:glyoxylate carboligase
VNTNRETQGIAECEVKKDAGRISIRIVGVGEDGPIEWPIADAQVLANLEEEAGQRAVALAANFDFGFMTAETYIRVNKGVLVIVLFAGFRDQSGRSGYVNREFFYRKD